MKKIIFLVYLTLSLGQIMAQKTYVMHYLPVLNYEQARSYKGYDCIVVDHEVINTSAPMLRYMKSVNPNLIIMVYSEKMQWHWPMFPDKPWSIKMVNTLKKYPKWFLLDTNGENLKFWPGTIMMNCKTDCPRYLINGKSYNYIEYFSERYIKDIIASYKKEGIKLNGILDDDLFKEITFLNGSIDSNHDGLEDEPAELNRQWRLGNAYFLEQVRNTMGKDFIIIGNGGHGYYMNVCNGKQMENFPETFIGDWYTNMTNAGGMKLAFFNARTGNKDNWLFTLCSSMLLDNVYFSQGQNTPYDNKFNLHLGRPLEKSFSQDGLYLRKFQNGTIYVNPETEKAWITP